MADLSFNIWAVIILVGAGQGFFLSFYFLTKSENRKANKWLALLLTIVSVHLLEYAASISGITLKYPDWMAVTYPVLFCMGPLYLIYCRYLLNRDYKLTWKSVSHFIPAFLVFILMLPFYTTASSEKVNFIKGLSSGENFTVPTDQLLFMGVHVLQTVTYILVAYRFIKRKGIELKQFSSNTVDAKKLSWLNSFNSYFATYLMLYFLLVVVLSVIQSYQVQIDYLLLLITSFSIYAIGYTAIGNPEIFRSLPEQTIKVENEQVEIAQRKNHRNLEMREKLLYFMETNKPYLKSDLKISELAELISVPYYQLSQFINEEFDVNFYDFINKYRVEEAKKLLLEDENNYKILAIAYEVGFNSKATFNRVFKKLTDLTPSEFREKSIAIRNATPTLQPQ